jgi:hypothetical protein
VIRLLATVKELGARSWRGDRLGSPAVTRQDSERAADRRRERPPRTQNGDHVGEALAAGAGYAPVRERARRPHNDATGMDGQVHLVCSNG